MELGDSVYDAERIMKKRIRKVSFDSGFAKATPASEFAKRACEIAYHICILI